MWISRRWYEAWRSDVAAIMQRLAYAERERDQHEQHAAKLAVENTKFRDAASLAREHMRVAMTKADFLTIRVNELQLEVGTLKHAINPLAAPPVVPQIATLPMQLPATDGVFNDMGDDAAVAHGLATAETINPFVNVADETATLPELPAVVE